MATQVDEFFGSPGSTTALQIPRRGRGTGLTEYPTPDGASPGPAAWAGRVSLAVDLHTLHLVVEGLATRLTSDAGLTRASTAMLEVYGWPTTVAGRELDAAFGAPTSGGPPYRAYELAPARAFAFPTDDQVEPTRFTW